MSAAWGWKVNEYDFFFLAPENPWNNSCLLKKLYFPMIWDSQVLCFILIADPGSFAPCFPSTRRTALQPVQTGWNISSTDRRWWRWWWSVSQSIPQSPQMNNIESEHMKQVVSEIIDISSKGEGFYHPAIPALFLVGSELHQLRFTGRYQRKCLPGLDGVCPVCFVLKSPKKMP